MKIQRVDLEHCGTESDCVVVIDVLRAFTTAAVAFAHGAREIILAGTIEELFDLAARYPDALTVGEVNGIPIKGVDFGNSPSALGKIDLAGKRLIQRTTAGTQGVLRSSNSRELLATSLCCAGATVRYIREANPDSLTLVESGVFESGEGDEDRVCADLIEAELTGKAADCPKLIERVMRSKNAEKFSNWGDAIFPREDLLIASEIDRYDFAMRVSLASGLHILRQVRC